ncbi:UDP-N-acetylhexosamine pyrophosphorylase [Harmonia axyridis]|uniref:UDP-N-acetylhexosamine pyrophosphorylase n=1 Tax=Harmonia axyridis TaxID=115357 RepID=UPI001E278C7D|nr:UDP-N-acetylhexosamine pyrophosphorylase [Harmonia axyridis]
MLTYTKIQSMLEECGQSHLLNFFNELSEAEQQQLLNQISSVNFHEANELFGKAMKSLDGDLQEIDSLMEPVPESQFEAEDTCDPIKLENYRNKGLEEISKGNIGVLLMAGGQGTRLGVTYPKGMYSVGLPSGKTLFQIQAERIRRLQTLAERRTGIAGCIPWYIMTSGRTHEETRHFLEKNDYFGLDKDNVVLFEQGLLPCFNYDGKIILDQMNVISMAPDGNGGIYKALHQNGILEDMNRRGVKYVHAHSVDNILVKVADPVFVGYCLEKGADCGAKVVKKASPTEAVGVVCKVAGHYQVVEYSEVSEETAKKTNDKGELLFNAGNICNHFFTVDFLAEVARKHDRFMKVHVAKKKIPYVDEHGVRYSPKSPNGIKIEKFVFDVFQFTDNFVTWEVPRYTEFSALKNPDEVARDCPSTARRDILNLHKVLVERAGGVVDGEIEISPLLSYSGEDLESKVKGKVFDSYMTVLIQSDEEIVKHKSNGVINGHN